MNFNKLNITFKKLKKEDLTLLYKWFQMSHILRWYARDEKYGLEKLETKYLPRLDDPSIKGFIIYNIDHPVGYIQLYCLDHYLPETMDYSHPLFKHYKPEEIAGVDIFIADTNYLRKRFATQALDLFIDLYIKNKFKITIVDPLRQNTTAISFFKQNGFEPILSQEETHLLLAKE